MALAVAENVYWQHQCHAPKVTTALSDFTRKPFMESKSEAFMDAGFFAAGFLLSLRACSSSRR